MQLNCFLRTLNSSISMFIIYIIYQGKQEKSSFKNLYSASHLYSIGRLAYESSVKLDQACLNILEVSSF